ncbi:hypothetical protein ICNMLN_ICNMLN_06540, partial [Dysosmobacter welbionis]
GSGAIGGPNRAGNCNAATVSACSPSKPSAQLRARRDGIIHHDEVQALLTVLGVDGGDQHAVALQAHHLPGRQVHNGDQGLAHQILRLIPLVDAGEDLPVHTGAVIQSESQQLLTLLHGIAGLHLHRPEIGLAEGVKIHLL